MKVTSGSPMTNASVTNNTGACRPVRSCCLRAQIRKMIAPKIPTSNAISAPPNPSLKIGVGTKQTTIVEKDAPTDRNTVANVRQRFKHRVVPEQQLQQQRQIANDFYVTARNFCQQPVARKPRYADDEAENSRKHDADPGHQQRIE